MKVVSKHPNAMKQHEILQEAMLSMSNSLNEVSRHIENWPIQPTVDSNNKIDSTIEGKNNAIDLKDFAKIFGLFANLVAPLEAAEAFQKVHALRSQVHEARLKFQQLKQNKDSVGPEAVLEQATKLRPLLANLRRAESDFVYVLLHQWRAAMQTVTSDLNELEIKYE